MALKLYSSAVYGHKNLQRSSTTPNPRLNFGCITPALGLNFKTNRICRTSPKIFCSVEMSAGQSDDSRKLGMDDVIVKARTLWDSAPQPVKSFPWDKALENFIQLIIDLALVVIKYLSIPVFLVTSVSEMSYCAHERKLKLVPVPFLIGMAVADVLRSKALKSSPYLKDAEVPWHLIFTITLFALLKIPGPYYPYWGRIFIPHFANGVILRTLWFMFQSYRKPRTTSERIPDSSIDIPEPEMA